MSILMWILFVLCIVSLGWTIHCSVVYYQFSKNIKNWAIELDNAMLEALDNAARKLLMDMDARIAEAKANGEIPEEEINNDNKIDEDEKVLLKQES